MQNRRSGFGTYTPLNETPEDIVVEVDLSLGEAIEKGHYGPWFRGEKLATPQIFEAMPPDVQVAYLGFLKLGLIDECVGESFKKYKSGLDKDPWQKRATSRTERHVAVYNLLRNLRSKDPATQGMARSMAKCMREDYNKLAGEYAKATLPTDTYELRVALRSL